MKFLNETDSNSSIFLKYPTKVGNYAQTYYTNIVNEI